MKLGKIFICINILVLSLLMLTGWPRIIYQNTDYRFDEHNRTIVLDDGYDLILHFVEEQPLKITISQIVALFARVYLNLTRSLTQRQKNFRYIGMERFISNDRLAAHVARGCLGQRVRILII